MPTDLSTTQSDRIMRALLGVRLALFVGAFLLINLGLVAEPLRFTWTYSTRLSAIVLAVAGLTTALLWAGMRARFWKSPAFLGQLLADQALWSAVVYLSGGPGSGATSLYGITCLMGGIALGVPGVVAAAVGAIVSYGMVTLLLVTGTWQLPPDQIGALSTPEQTTFVVIINVLALLLVALLVSYLAERLTHTSGALLLAEGRAARAERMAALGRLASGLAHEIRNPLSAISGSVQMLRATQTDLDDQQLCDIVLSESKRLETLVSDMLELSRPKPPELARVSLLALLREVVQLGQASGRGQTDVRIVLAETPIEEVEVWADASQLRQLFWNLIRNAVEASIRGGEVRIRVQAGPTVSVLVEDDGSGIDPDALPNIFDAYYTTRSQGTGIGLAIVKRIADDHRFRIVVTSHSGKGACFAVQMGKNMAGRTGPSVRPPPPP